MYDDNRTLVGLADLAERRHAANGIVFPDLSGPYFAEVILGYEEVASELGRSVLILSANGRTGIRDMVLDLASRVDGLVIFGRTVDDEVAAEIAVTGLPLVLLARPAIADADSVSAENTQSARDLAEHLIGVHGYRDLALLGDPSASKASIVHCGFDEDAGYAAARGILTKAKRPDALVCANDEVALGAMTAAEDLGLRVPDELAVTGWDDVMAARYARLTQARWLWRWR